MKVIINNHTTLSVEDENGNILFQWLPKEKFKNVTEIHSKSMSEDDKKYIIEQLRKMSFINL